MDVDDVECTCATGVEGKRKIYTVVFGLLRHTPTCVSNGTITWPCQITNGVCMVRLSPYDFDTQLPALSFAAQNEKWFIVIAVSVCLIHFVVLQTCTHVPGARTLSLKLTHLQPLCPKLLVVLLSSDS